MNSNPFRRAASMMALVTAAMTAFPRPGVAQAAALNALDPYISRGKRKTRRHDRGGTKAFQRAAAKARNRRAHR